MKELANIWPKLTFVMLKDCLAFSLWSAGTWKSMVCSCGTLERKKRETAKAVTKFSVQVFTLATEEIWEPQIKTGGKAWNTVWKALKNGPFFKDLKNCKEEPVCRMIPFASEEWGEGYLWCDLLSSTVKGFKSSFTLPVLNETLAEGGT